MPGSQRAAVEGTGNNYTPDNNTRVESDKTREKRERIEKANKLYYQAKDAADRKDAYEALRLAKEAQDMAKDHKWLSGMVKYWERYIRFNRAADAQRNGDIAGALTVYHELLAEDPDYFSKEGKQQIKDLEQYLEEQNRLIEIEKKYQGEADKTKENLKEQFRKMTPGEKDIVPSGNLDYITVPDNKKTGLTEDLETRTIRGIIDYMANSNWDTAEIRRVKETMNQLSNDQDTSVTRFDVIQAWLRIYGNELGQKSTDIEKAAASGAGPQWENMPVAGEQFKFQDCTIFSLANATGRPYSVVAALATNILAKASWRTDKERLDPENTIKNTGLNGGEVILLTEQLGKVVPVPKTEISKKLKEGRALMVNIIPPNGDFRAGHEVVISKTFQYNNETWYEMIDSYKEDSRQRRYLSEKHLFTILKERPLSYQADEKSTPVLLR